MGQPIFSPSLLPRSLLSHLPFDMLVSFDKFYGSVHHTLCVMRKIFSLVVCFSFTVTNKCVIDFIRGFFEI